MIFTILNSTASIKLVWWGDFKRNFCICTDKIQSMLYVASWSVPVPQWGSTSQRRSGTQTPPSSSAAPASVSTSSASSPLTSASTLPSSGSRWALIGGYWQFWTLIGPGRGVGRHRERELERAGGRADQPRDRPRHDLAQDQLCQVAGKIFHKNIWFKLDIAESFCECFVLHKNIFIPFLSIINKLLGRDTRKNKSNNATKMFSYKYYFSTTLFPKSPRYFPILRLVCLPAQCPGSKNVKLCNSIFNVIEFLRIHKISQVPGYFTVMAARVQESPPAATWSVSNAPILAAY